MKIIVRQCNTLPEYRNELFENFYATSNECTHA